MQRLPWRISRWWCVIGLGVVLLRPLPASFAQEPLPCWGRQEDVLRGIRVFRAPQALSIEQDVVGAVGISDTLFWWCQPTGEPHQSLRIWWYRLSSGELSHSEELPLPEIPPSAEKIRRTLCGFPPQQLFPATPRERIQQWDSLQQLLSALSDESLVHAIADGRREVSSPDGFWYAVDVGRVYAAALLSSNGTQHLVLWQRTPHGWRVDTAIFVIGGATALRFLDDSTLALWGCQKVGLYVPYTFFLRLQPESGRWRILGEHALPNPEGLIFTVFQPRRLMDLSRSWIAIADAVRYRIRLYRYGSLQTPAALIEHSAPFWKPITDTAYRTLDRDPYRFDIKELMDTVRVHAYTASLIQSVVFLDSVTLGVYWYPRRPLPHDSGTVLESSSRRGYVRLLDIWQYRRGVWQLIQEGLCPANPLRHTRFSPANAPPASSTFCDGKGNCFSPLKLPPGVIPEKHRFGELDSLLEQHSRDSDSISMGILWYRWAAALSPTPPRPPELPRRMPETPPSSARPPIPEIAHTWKAVTLQGETLTVATLAPVVAVLFLSGYSCFECIPDAVDSLSAQVQGFSDAVRWVALCLTHPNTLARRRFYTMVRKALPREHSWTILFDICSDILPPVQCASTISDFPCTWWQKLRLCRTPAIALFHDGKLVRVQRYEELGLKQK